VKRAGFLAGVAAIAAGIGLRGSATALGGSLSTANAAQTFFPSTVPAFDVVGGTTYTFAAYADGAEVLIAYFDCRGRELARAPRGTSQAPRRATTARIGFIPTVPPPRSAVMAQPCVTIGDALPYGPA
jgi:hypothetical protein